MPCYSNKRYRKENCIITFKRSSGLCTLESDIMFEITELNTVYMWCSDAFVTLTCIIYYIFYIVFHLRMIYHKSVRKYAQCGTGVEGEQ